MLRCIISVISMMFYVYFQLFPANNLGHIQPFAIEIVQTMWRALIRITKWIKLPTRMTAGILTAQATTIASVAICIMGSSLKWMVIENDETCALSLATAVTALVIKRVMTFEFDNSYVPKSERHRRTIQARVLLLTRHGAATLEKQRRRILQTIQGSHRLMTDKTKDMTTTCSPFAIMQKVRDKLRWHRAISKHRQRTRSVAFGRIALTMLFSLIVTCSYVAEAHGQDEVAYAMHNVLTVMNASTKRSPDTMHHQYDSDSYILAIDNCSSRCITNNLSDYISKPQKVEVKVRGIAGTVSATYKGTVRWKIEDDAGVTHTWLIPDTYYHTTSPYRLLSPQHWSQTRKEGHGSYCVTYDDQVDLFWQQCEFVRSVPLDTNTNIALIRSKPEFKRFAAFSSEVAQGTVKTTVSRSAHEATTARSI